MARATIRIPASGTVTLKIQNRDVRLSNLDKVFWADPVITKSELLQYYADVAPVLLPHIRERAMVMKRYPHGVGGDFFFMKRAPAPRPDWIRICSVRRRPGGGGEDRARWALALCLGPILVPLINVPPSVPNPGRGGDPPGGN